MIYNKIKWEPSETIFKIGDFGIHYYSLMFVLAFTIGYYLMKRMFNKEKISEEFIEPLLVYVVFSTLIGARLGEVFFYNWDYYSNHLIEILLPIRKKENGGFLFGLLNNYEFIGFRGLASHGASIGIILGLYIYQRKYNYKPLLWLLDRLSIPVCLGAFFVRIGYFFNSEIVGKYTGNNFGVIFINRGETLPRHPTQLYESFGYLILFLILNYLYKNRENNNGYLFGIFLSTMFTIRFIVEFLKESQGGFESKLTLFSTGQWLSIPMILSGLFIIIYSFKKLKS